MPSGFNGESSNNKGGSMKQPRVSSSQPQK